MIKKTLVEALGVPDNIYETSIILANEIIDEFKKYPQDKNLNNGDIIEFRIDGNFRIADYKFPSVKVTVKFETCDKCSEAEILSMHVLSDSKKVDIGKLKNIPTEVVDLHMEILILNDFRYGDLVNFTIENKKEFVTTLSHELKHAYDHFKQPYDKAKVRALYSGISGKRFGIDAIDFFIHDIYYTLFNENLVRPTEIITAIKQNKISQKNFLKFLGSNVTYKNLKRIANFSYENLRKKVEEDLPRVDKFLRALDVDTNGMSDDEKVDKILELVYINISNWSIEQYKSIISTDFLEGLFGFQGEKDRIFQKFVQRNRRFKTTEEFFRFYEKQFKYVANNMLKKVSKLYALVGKDK